MRQGASVANHLMKATRKQLLSRAYGLCATQVSPLFDLDLNPDYFGVSGDLDSSGSGYLSWILTVSGSRVVHSALGNQ